MTLAEQIRAETPWIDEDNRRAAVLRREIWLDRLKYGMPIDHTASSTCRDCHGIGHLNHDNTIECPRCGGEGRV